MSIAQADEDLSRLTVVLRTDRSKADALARHVEKLVDVVEALVPEPDSYFALETAILRIRVAGEDRDRAAQALRVWGGQVLSFGETEIVGFLSHRPDRIDEAMADLSLHGSLTAMRSGALAMPHESPPTLVLGSASRKIWC